MTLLAPGASSHRHTSMGQQRGQTQAARAAHPGYTKGQPLTVLPPLKALNPFAPPPQQQGQGYGQVNVLSMLLMASPKEGMTSSCVSSASGGGGGVVSCAGGNPYACASSPSPMSAPPPALPSPLSAPPPATPSAPPSAPSSGPSSPTDHAKGRGVWEKTKKGGGASKGSSKGSAKGPPSAFSSPPRNGRQFKGVRRRKWGKVVCEMRGAQGRRIWLGSFETEVEAARVYDEAARIFQGDKAWLNFPEAKAGTAKLSPEIVATLLQHRSLAETLRSAKGQSTSPNPNTKTNTSPPSSPAQGGTAVTATGAPTASASASAVPQGWVKQEEGVKEEEMPLSAMAAMETEGGGSYVYEEEEGEEEMEEGKVAPELLSGAFAAAGAGNAAGTAATAGAGTTASAGAGAGFATCAMGKSESVKSYASNCSSLSHADAPDADAASHPHCHSPAAPFGGFASEEEAQHVELCPAAQQREVILRAQQQLQHLQQLQQQCAHAQQAIYDNKTSPNSNNNTTSFACTGPPAPAPAHAPAPAPAATPYPASPAAPAPAPVFGAGPLRGVNAKKGGEEWDNILSSFEDTCPPPCAESWMSNGSGALSSPLLPSAPLPSPPLPSVLQSPSPSPAPSHYGPQGAHPSPAYAPGTPEVYPQPHPFPHPHSHPALLPSVQGVGQCSGGVVGQCSGGAGGEEEEEEGGVVAMETFGDLPPLDLEELLAPSLHEPPAPLFDAQAQAHSHSQPHSPSQCLTHAQAQAQSHSQFQAQAQGQNYSQCLAHSQSQGQSQSHSQCLGQGQGQGQGHTQGYNAPAMAPACYSHHPHSHSHSHSQGQYYPQPATEPPGVYQGAYGSVAPKGMSGERVGEALAAAFAKSPQAASLASSLATYLANSLSSHVAGTQQVAPHVPAPCAAPLGPPRSHMADHLLGHSPPVGGHMVSHVPSHSGHVTPHVTLPQSQPQPQPQSQSQPQPQHQAQSQSQGQSQGQPGAAGPDPRAAAETLVAAIIASGLSALLGLPQN